MSTILGEIQYEDRSYNTVHYKIGVKSPLSDEEIDDIIEKSGLCGLTVGDGYLEAYYVGDPNDRGAIAEWERGIDTVKESLGGSSGEDRRETWRLWVYGNGSGAIPYGEIEGDLRTGEAKTNLKARRVAARLRRREIIGVVSANRLSRFIH